MPPNPKKEGSKDGYTVDDLMDGISRLVQRKTLELGGSSIRVLFYMAVDLTT